MNRIQHEKQERAEDLYLIGEWSLTDISKQLGISIQTLKRWSSAAGWAKERKFVRSEARSLLGTLVRIRHNLQLEAKTKSDPQISYAVVKITELIDKKKAEIPKKIEPKLSATTMDPYQIEKGIPIPERTLRRSKYPFGAMVKGDSFFIPISDKKRIQTKRNSAYAAASHFAKRHKKLFTISAVKGGLRVWCLK